ncbi:MAG TPA: cation:proton antiporter [bacterium]|nr:cation:proton antiporter [bacterium]
MGELAFLRDLVVIFAVAVVVVAVLQKVGIPSIAGFIVAGILVGPHGSGLIRDLHDVEILAEVGVVLLLFGIGLELSLDRVRRLWQPILIGGTLQMGLSILVCMVLAIIFGMAPASAIFLGFLVAVSSTAIVLRALNDRGELEAPHGRLTLGILVFQDLSVVPMMLAIPILAGTGTSAMHVLLTLGKAVGVLAGVLIAARIIVPRALHLVARTRQRNLFMLSTFLVCLGTAWIVSSAGISLALGAFMAGLVVAGSEYRHQALADLFPFREVLTSVFFVSVGMLLDASALLDHPLPIVGLLVAIIAGKFLVVLLTGLSMRLPARVSILSAAGLAQVGEFYFVLLRAGQSAGIVDAHWGGAALAANLSAAAIFSMIIAPLALAAGPHIAAGAGRIRVLTQYLGVREAGETAEQFAGLQDHVIVAGLGVVGLELAHSLREAGIAYILVDLNAENVRRAARNGEPACFGDVTSPEVLEAVGAPHARELVLAINDPGAALRAIGAARRIAPDLHIVIRSRYVGDIRGLLTAGANKVVPAELEAAAEITSYMLDRHAVPPDVRFMQLARIRARLEDPALRASSKG